MTRKNLIFTTFIVSLLAFFSLLAPSSAFAATGQSFEVSPSKEKFHFDPGAYYSGTVSVHNNGTVSSDFSVSIIPYRVSNHNYSPVYEASKFTQIADWIELGESSFSLDPGATKDIPYTISIPTDVPAGAQYAMIAIDSLNKSTENATISVVQSVGVIISAEISGETRVDGEILEESANGFLFTPPISAKTVVSNTGNVNNTVSCVLRVTNFFDGSQVYSNANAPAVYDIYPETTRDIVVAWDGSPHLGLFRVALTTSYLDEVSTFTKVVFLCPVWFISVIAIVLVFLLTYIVVKVRKRLSIHRKASGF